jgi:hypothetical protein
MEALSMKPFVRYLLHLVLLLAAGAGGAHAQGSGSFPVPYGPSNLGKEFYFSFPTNYEDPTASAQYIRLYITSPVRTRVQIYTGTILKKTLFTVPNDIVSFDLTKFEAQALSRDTRQDVPPDLIYRRHAVHVIADDPIVLYGMNRTSYTSDGMLILPVNALGTDYVVAAAKDYLTGGFFPDKLPSQFVITAAFDATTVSIETPMETPSHRAGEVYSIQLNKGDVYSSMSFGPGGDLTGAVIAASKPVALTAGQNCTYLPDQRYPACDHIEEMEFPISTWGTVYHSVPFATRLKGDLFRIFASEDGTDIYINGVKKFNLTRRGGPEGAGWVEYLPPTRELLEFSSNKPIMVAQYNNSQQYDGVVSDPFFMVLTPVEQYQNQFVFTTPKPGDFQGNYLTIVSDSAGYDKIEFSKTGSNDWKNLAQSIPRAVKSFVSTVNGRRYVGVTFDIDPAAYKMRGPEPFAAYVYGFGSYDSYGYPLSAALSDLRSPDVDRPLVTKTKDCNGFVTADVLDMPEDINIRSNLSSVDLLPESFNYAIEVDYFEAGLSPGTSYRLRVVDGTKDALAIVQIYDKAGNVTYDTTTFTAVNVVADPNDVDFGTLFTGQSGTRTLTLRNLSARQVTITQTQLQKGDQGFTIVDPTTSFTLDSAGKAGAEKVVTVRFDATAAGDFVDSLGIRDECGFHWIAALRANVGTPIIQVSDEDFGKWPLAAPAKPGRIYIRNVSTDGGKLTVTGVAQDINDKVVFTLPNGLPAFPLVIAAGDEVPLNVAFKPGAVRPYLDSIVFNHNAPPNAANDPTGVLKGEGIQGALVATSFDWGRRRVGSGPHPATLTLTNVGTSDITLRTPVTLTGDVGDFAIVDQSVLSNKVLAPNGSVDLAVTFTPTTTGPRTMVITYPHDPAQAEPVTSTLDGFGTQPALVTTDYDYGTMNIGGSSDNTRTIVFELPPPTNPDVMDSVTIVRWDYDPSGDPDFRADLPATPIVLKRSNPSVSFTGYFRAQQVGARRTALTAVTADGVDATSNWTGNGTAVDAIIGGTGVSFGVLCAGDSTLDAVITNDQPVPVTITALQLSGLPASFRINPTPSLPVTLRQGESLRVPITYSASGNGVFDGFLEVSNTSVNAPVLQLRVQGASIEQTVASSVVLAANGPNGQVELGKEFMAAVHLDEPANTGLAVNTVRVTMSYDQTKMEPKVSDLKTGNSYSTASLQLVSNTPGTLVVDVTSPTGFTTIGDLLTLPFGVYFTADRERAVSATITTEQAACLTFATAPDSIEVAPICGLSVRMIELTASSYALRQNSPNPFNPVTKIGYSLGLDGRTRMVLHDAAGKLIQVLLDEEQQPGTYELTLDVTDLPSGVYYYTLTSGTWSATRSLTVTK